jgi:hypothetical protein
MVSGETEKKQHIQMPNMYSEQKSLPFLKNVAIFATHMIYWKAAAKKLNNFIINIV